MNTHADKMQDSRSLQVSDKVPQKKHIERPGFQMKDNRSKTFQMQKLQALAAHSKRTKQLMKIKEMADNNPRIKQLKAIRELTSNNSLTMQSDRLKAITAPHAGAIIQKEKASLQHTPTKQKVIQRAIKYDDPVKTLDSGRAGRVEVENIRGKPYGESHNSPSVAPFGWPELHTAGHTLANPNANNSHYNAVRMHLWNGRLSGPGDQTWNLAPGPAAVNSSMSAGPEIGGKRRSGQRLSRLDRYQSTLPEQWFQSQ